jgi:phosphatidate cytidylyltransferase
LAVLISANLLPGTWAVLVSVTAGASWLLVSRIFIPKGNFENSLNQIAAGFSVIVYPGLFMIWLMKMTQMDHAEFLILGFMAFVIGNDSAGWAAGMLFGRGNRGIIAASPNKSAAGFIGGLAASVLVGIGIVRFAPQVFTARFLPQAFSGVILGLGCALTASLGDLAESVIKRSAAVKDSGAVVPGRGGILDSIDSIALTAPVFYGLYCLLFG